MGKGKKKRGIKPKGSRTTRGLSDQLSNLAYEGSAMMSGLNLEPDAAALETKRQHCRDPFQMISLMKDLIATTHTIGVEEQNRLYPCENGDQHRLPSDQQAQVFRNLWADGFDLSVCLQLGLFPSFTTKCIVGDLTGADYLLKSAPDAATRKQLLETRSTVFRGSPLQLVIAYAKYPQVVAAMAERHGTNTNFEASIRYLLKNGANPDVKDIAGKTIVHWGAGGITTAENRKFVSWCINAARSSQHFGEVVTLKGLSNTMYNNKEGILGGYDVDTGRRVVMVSFENGETKELSVQTENIFYNDQCIYQENYNLVDIPDRLGSVVLHEVIMRGDPATANFLCKEQNASVDVPDLSGVTPRYMALRPMGGMESETMRIIKEHACRNSYTDNSCGNCGGKGAQKKCSRCGDIWYCNRDCQVAHWKVHKKDCKKQEKIKLDPPDLSHIPSGYNEFASNRNGIFSDGGYSKPKHVKTNELFYVKLQRPLDDDGMGSILLYDKSRECQFAIQPFQTGYQALIDQIKKEKGSYGTKTHFQAKFNEKGEMFILPNSSKLLAW